jgi:hypothetical protein
MYDQNNNNGGYQQQGGYEQNRSGEADQYYSGGQQQQYQNEKGYGQQQGYGQQPPGYQHHQSIQDRDSYGQGYDNQASYETQQGFENSESERGLMGGLAGGAAGAFGGHKMGGVTGHNKTSTIFGAVAGAFAGHKLQDGVEDWKDDRDDKKKEEKRRKEEEERRKQEQQQQHQYDSGRPSGHDNRDDQRRGGNYAGNFTSSSRDIRLDAHSDYNLHASCQRLDGSYKPSTISLNSILENDDGSFHWSKGTRGGGPSSVTVQQGDTLRAIAARHNCNFHDIAKQNGIQNEDMIYPGQLLIVLGGGSGGGANFGASARDVRLVDGGQRLVGELQRDGRWVESSVVLDERIENRDGCLEFV